MNKLNRKLNAMQSEWMKDLNNAMSICEGHTGDKKCALFAKTLTSQGYRVVLGGGAVCVSRDSSYISQYKTKRLNKNHAAELLYHLRFGNVGTVISVSGIDTKHIA